MTRPLVPQGRMVDGNMRTESLRTLAFRAKIDGVPVVLLRPDWGASNLFRGDRIYGGSYNQLEAYLYFSRCPPTCCAPLPLATLDVALGCF